MTKPKRKRGEASALAREIHAADPTLGPTEIAERVSAQLRIPYTKQAVDDALRSSSTRGRPRQQDAPVIEPSARQKRIARKLSSAKAGGESAVAAALHSEYVRGRKRLRP